MASYSTNSDSEVGILTTITFNCITKIIPAYTSSVHHPACTLCFRRQLGMANDAQNCLIWQPNTYCDKMTSRSTSMIALKSNSCHDAKFVVTGGTKGSHDDNFNDFWNNDLIFWDIVMVTCSSTYSVTWSCRVTNSCFIALRFFICWNSASHSACISTLWISDWTLATGLLLMCSCSTCSWTVTTTGGSSNGIVCFHCSN